MQQFDGRHQLSSSLAGAPIMCREKSFREMLLSPKLAFVMEAHDALSAKIVENAGFPGIWASGLSMSTALGVRDANEASWSQVLSVLEFMSDTTSIPILVDGDTGYGNFNSVRRLVKKLCQRNIAAVCIEDKIFPKTNSFLGEKQPLAEIDEFCGRIKAGKDSQLNEHFSIVARVEALIAGLSVGEALQRANAYCEAGADAILIHSKAGDASEIIAFCKQWNGRSPLIVVPTKYFRTPTDIFRENGISMIIWANHNIRAAMAAMENVCQKIFQEQSVVKVEETIAPLEGIFDLFDYEELSRAERRYLPPHPIAPSGRSK